MDWQSLIRHPDFHRLIGTFLILAAPAMIFRRTYIPRRRMARVNLHILAESLRAGIPIAQMTEDERRKCNWFWLFRITLPVVCVVLALLAILWQDILFGA